MIKVKQPAFFSPTRVMTLSMNNKKRQKTQTPPAPKEKTKQTGALERTSA